MKALFLTGSRGFIAQSLIRRWLNAGGQVYCLLRSETQEQPTNGVHYVGLQDIELHRIQLPAFEAVIHLAGYPIAKRLWTRSVRKKIRASRVDTGRLLVQWMQTGVLQTHCYMTASAVGIYGDGCATLEDQEPQATDFLASVCRDWEQVALDCRNPDIRVLRLRFGLVLGKEGLLKRLIPIYRAYAGAVLGNGKQWVSWIHIDDLIEAMLHLLHDPTRSGAFNVTAPNPVTMRHFSKLLAGGLHRPLIGRIPACVLKRLLGDLSSLFLFSQKALPTRLQASRFEFRYVHLDEAFKQLLNH